MSIILKTDRGHVVPHSTIHFSGGEVQVRIDDASTKGVFGDWTIEALLYNSDRIMELLLVTDAVRRACPGSEINLIAPYLPYARQDRVCAPGEAFALSVMTKLLMVAAYKSITVWDVHSDMSRRLLLDDNFINIPASTFVRKIATPRMVLVAPDEGALMRVSECAIACSLEMRKAVKHRDPSTGAITGTEVDSKHIGDRDFLMVDDICDGGRTFIELAKKLRPLTAGKVKLYVTHGIMSQGMGVLLDHIDEVFIANPFPGLATTFTQV